MSQPTEKQPQAIWAILPTSISGLIQGPPLSVQKAADELSALNRHMSKSTNMGIKLSCIRLITPKKDYKNA